MEHCLYIDHRKQKLLGGGTGEDHNSMPVKDWKTMPVKDWKTMVVEIQRMEKVVWLFTLWA